MKKTCVKDGYRDRTTLPKHVREVERAAIERGDTAENPLAAFTEWTSEADRRAYRSLQGRVGNPG